MWLFTKRGFFSIVQHKDDPNLLLVRSRVKGDIEEYWPWAIVKEDEGSDYRYRAFMPRFEVVNRLGNIAHDIDYPDFKASVDDTRRMSWYYQVWEAMSDMQEVFRARYEKENAEGSD